MSMKMFVTSKESDFGAVLTTEISTEKQTCSLNGDTASMEKLVCVKAARGLWLYGSEMRDRNMTRAEFCEELHINDDIFRSHGEDLGVRPSNPGLRFFEATRNVLAFGPGAGLVLSASIGTQSLRAALVDANGQLHCKAEAEHDPEQLAFHPDDLLNRLRDTFGQVLERAFDEKKLLVAEKLPLMRVAVAWPAPVTREKQTVGHALQNEGWRRGDPLDSRVAQRLKVRQDRSDAINDAAAAAVGVAYLQTTTPEHRRQENPRLAMVLRLSGGIGGATIVVEPKESNEKLGSTSGFRRSILTGGLEHLAGEIGHIPVEPALVEKLNRERDEGLGEVEAAGCSCVPPGQESPRHLEAYVGAASVARRIDPSAAAVQVAKSMIAEPEKDVHSRVLEDVGTLVGKSLVAPVAMLNPATIVLTGALAVDPVATALETAVSEDHVLGRMPEVTPLDPEENDFIRVKGAGMVVLRAHLLRELPKLLRGPKASLTGKVRRLTEALPKIPW
ncbi:MAG TPA: ROK family protein [Solirubrobacterales bacterium]